MKENWIYFHCALVMSYENNILFSPTFSIFLYILHILLSIETKINLPILKFLQNISSVSDPYTQTSANPNKFNAKAFER